MKQTDLQQYQLRLSIHRDEILKMLYRLGDEARASNPDSPQDFGDMCMTSSVKESLFQQRAHLTGLVRRIEGALTRIREGEYGLCTACGDEINRKRLEALPWTQYCIRCQEASEQQGAAWSQMAQARPAMGLHR